MNLKVFENIKNINQYHQEYREARDLAKVLEYSEYRHFKPVIEKAKIACINSWYEVNEHFEDILGTQKSRNQYWEVEGRTVDDIRLSRYACYLIVQNADPSKEIVALGQTYFALQTRKQELQDQNLKDQERVHLRNEMTTHNKKLASTANKAGGDKLCWFYRCRLSMIIRPNEAIRYPQTQETQKRGEDTWSYGERGIGGESFSCYTDGSQNQKRIH